MTTFRLRKLPEVKKALTVISSAVFFGVCLNNPAFGVVKAGSSCAKVGSASVVSGKKFTCVKSGKKLVWDKGTLITKPMGDSPITQPIATSQAIEAKPEAYSIQWSLCEEPLSGHEGWVLGKNANQTEFTFLRCTNSRNEDGSSTVIWQIPEDAAKFDQNTKLPIAGTGYIPKFFSTKITWPDWFFYTPEKHPKSPTSFSDLYENRAGISYAVWSTIVASPNKFKGEIPNIQIMASNPRATYSQLGIQNLIFLHKAMNSPIGIKTVRIYYFDRATITQVAAQVENDMGADEYKKGQQNQGGPLVQCYGTSDCNNSNAWATGDGILYLFMGIANNQDSHVVAGGVEPTEYFHAVWSYIYAKNNAMKPGNSPAIFPSNQPPYWLNIGLEIISRNISHTQNDFKNYMEFSRVDSTWVYKTIPDFSEAWLNNYLDISNLGNRWSDAHLGLPNDTAVIIGPKIMEILFSIQGTPAYFDFYQRMSQGEQFDAIFKDIYKITWQEARPMIAKIIFEQLTE